MSNYSKGFEKLGVDLSKVTSGGLTTCPECSEDRKPSNQRKKVLWLSKEKGTYLCHHCGINGRVDSNEWIEEKHGRETGLIKHTPSIPHQYPKQKKQPL